MSLSRERRAGRESVLSSRNGQAFVYRPFGHASHSASSWSSNVWLIFCFMLFRRGFFRVVSLPQIGANDVPALALGTVRRESELFVLALVSPLAAEESGMVIHVKKKEARTPSPCLT